MGEDDLGGTPTDPRQCARCGHLMAAGHTVCAACGATHGARRRRAAGGSGTAVLLGGVVPAPTPRALGAVALDLAALGILSAFGVLLVQWAGAPVASVVIAVFAWIAFCAVQLSALAQSGRSLGRHILGLRSVERANASPTGFSPALLLLVLAPLHNRFVTAQLRWGRDPLSRSFQPVPIEAITGGDSGSRMPAASSVAGAAPVGARAATSSAELPSAGSAGAPGPQPLVVLDSGERLSLDQALFIGRAPTQLPNLPSGTLFAWADLSRTISKTHVMIEWTGDAVTVTDLGSTNGTAFVDDDAEAEPLRPFESVRFDQAAELTLGDRSLWVHIGGAAQRVARKAEHVSQP